MAGFARQDCCDSGGIQDETFHLNAKEEVV